jgi:hypothetical protein
MRLSIGRIAAVSILVPLASMFAQESNEAITSVPRLLRITGTYHPANGLPVGTTESATLSIYRDQEGGQPLWQETQNVPVDANGQYTAMLGATQKEGIPVDLFSATEPRWLGVLFNRPGETEQPRIQLVSVPYALKASDAETLGGKPASAYLLAPSSDNSGQPAAASGTSTSTAPNPKAAKPRGITGTPTTNSIVKFTDS